MNVFTRLISSSSVVTSAADVPTTSTQFQNAAESKAAAQERLFGLSNFGATCYANSVLQALYFCEPFRQRVIEASKNGLQQPVPSPILSEDPSRKPSISGASKPPARTSLFPYRKKETETTNSDPNTSSKETNLQNVANDMSSPMELNPPADANTTLYTTLRDLFFTIASHPNKTGIIAPQAFILQLKKENELFRSSMHQDAHEFFNYLLNTVAEHLESDKPSSTKANSPPDISQKFATWIHQLFEGVLTNETRCLTCETVTSRDESFLDLSIDIEENTSVTACLRQFSASEMLYSKNKFSCDTCCGLQEAEKRMKIKQLPEVLALHLKRFKWRDDLQQFTKLTYRVVFPFEIRLFNTVDGSADSDRLYSLWAIVVHIGAGLHHGHYVTIIKSLGRWLLFDDDAITQIEEADIAKYYGDMTNTGSGYVLFYQQAEIVDSVAPNIPLTRMPSLQSSISNISGAPTANPVDFSPRPLLNKKKEVVPIQTGLALSRPAELAEPPSPSRSTHAASPVKERKSFFGLSRRSVSGSKLSSDDVSNSSRTDHTEGTTEELGFSLVDPPSQSTNGFPGETTSRGTIETLSSGGEHTSSSHATPAVNYNFPAAQALDASTNSNASTSSAPPSAERKLLGRMFGKSKKSVGDETAVNDDLSKDKKSSFLKRDRKSSKISK